MNIQIPKNNPTLPHQFTQSLKQFTDLLQQQVEQYHSYITQMIETESALKIPKGQTCSIEVLLVPPKALEYSLSHISNTNVKYNVHDLEGQIQAVLELINTFIYQHDKMKVQKTFISTIESLVNVEDSDYYDDSVDYLSILSDLIEGLDFDHNFDDDSVIDLLGVYKSPYCYNSSRVKCRIELYGLRILFCALKNRIKVRALNLKVLTHELSHWVSHIGKDTDGHEWRSFKQEEKSMIEGIAQDLTERSLQRMSQSTHSHSPSRRAVFSAAYIAYRQFLPHQPYAYQVHLNWAVFPQSTRQSAFIKYRKGLTYKSYQSTSDFEVLLNNIESIC